MISNQSKPQIVVFSDVDGVLVNPQTPAFAAAGSVLAQLAREGIPLILCSSKTRAELEFIRQKLRITDPFICENGAAAFVPAEQFDFQISSARDLAGYYVVEFGRPYLDVVATLRRTAERLQIPIVGFSDMSIQEVAHEWNLTLLEARLAKLREYEEPFQILDPDPAARNRLFRGLQAARLRCAAGHLFDHVGAPVDNSVGVTLLSTLYRQASGGVLSVGITDPLRDENLTALVDYPVGVHAGGVAEGTIAALDWAEAIVDTVQSIRRTHGDRTIARGG